LCSKQWAGFAVGGDVEFSPFALLVLWYKIINAGVGKGAGWSTIKSSLIGWGLLF